MPYDNFAAFVRDSAFKDGPKELKALSMDASWKCPKIVFKGRENLHAVLGNRIIKRKAGHPRTVDIAKGNSL